MQADDSLGRLSFKGVTSNQLFHRRRLYHTWQDFVLQRAGDFFCNTPSSTGWHK